MDFFNTGIPLGRYFGITVRLHFTFLIYAFYRVQQYGHIGIGLAYVAGLYGCILLHEFGHCLAARWCDGEADNIVLWPLGGLAFVRPAWNPTAHLITTVAGPFVTLVLWLMFWGMTWLLAHVFTSAIHSVPYLYWFSGEMMYLNRVLLIFNLIPAFPMDGGRILRDTIWHFTSAEKATTIAVWVSRVLAGLGAALALLSQNYWLLMFPLFIFMQSAREQQIVAYEAGGTYEFSVRERLRRGSRQREFRRGVSEWTVVQEVVARHTCTTCGLTDRNAPTMDFRVCIDCSDGQEYCRDHLDSHKHV